MTASVELQVISKILTSNEPAEVDALCEFDASYYSIFSAEIAFIFKHRDEYKKVPDLFTFQSRFPEFVVVTVNESLDFLKSELIKNKQRILFITAYLRSAQR